MPEDFNKEVKSGLHRIAEGFFGHLGKHRPHMLASVGFVDIQAQMDFAPHGKNGDYGCMTNRMIVIAEKREC